ncbi:MAG: hypothetical protein Q9183_004409, partial [Haloplaca sp. 2 TL-2023]
MASNHASSILVRTEILSLKLQRHCALLQSLIHRSKTSPSIPRDSRPTPRAISSTSTMRSLNLDNINPHIREAQYGVRGELAQRSEKYRAQLKKGLPPTPPEESLPFDQVISANIGNPQQLDQKPITFFRQVLSLIEYPALLESEDVLKKSLGYKQDVIDRARWLLNEVKSVGAYSASQGAPGIRESVARYIENRDGYPSDAANIFLSAGASS